MQMSHIVSAEGRASVYLYGTESQQQAARCALCRKLKLLQYRICLKNECQEKQKNSVLVLLKYITFIKSHRFKKNSRFVQFPGDTLSHMTVNNTSF